MTNSTSTDSYGTETTYYDSESDGEDYRNLDPEEKEELIQKVRWLSYAWFGTHLWIIILGSYVASLYRSRFRWQRGWFTK